jgi:hypothetical protein
MRLCGSLDGKVWEYCPVYRIDNIRLIGRVAYPPTPAPTIGGQLCSLLMLITLPSPLRMAFRG